VRRATLALLARPVSGADRARFLLISGSTAVAGGLLIAGARVAQLTMASDSGGTFAVPFAGDQTEGLAPYVTQAGLRPGVVLGAVLLTVPVLALAVQALRVGSVARERRLASLRLAGATPGDVRTVAGVEAGLAAAVGGLLAGPIYGLLWLVLGVMLPFGSRLVPTPTPVDLAVWAGVAAATALGGGVAGAVVQGNVVVDPLGVRRRAGDDSRSRWVNRGALTIGSLLLVGGWLAASPDRGLELVVLVAAILGILLLAFAGGSRLVRRRGRRLQRRGTAEDLLAGARLAAEPRAPGRVAAVLAVCGFALGLEAVIVTGLFGQDGPQGQDLGFYLTGFGMAGVGVLLAVVIAVLTLLVGAADQLLDARRPLASLAALGVDRTTLERVLRRQQSAAAVPSVLVGTGLGGLAAAVLGGDDASLGAGLLGCGLAALVAAVAVSVAVRATTRLLRSRLTAVLDPENLRVA
jgi:hypothetical protein